MQSFFCQLTDDDPGGLSDIVRSSGSSGATRTILGVNDLQFMAKPVNPRDFDDPFHDPLLHELASVHPADPMVSLAETTVVGGDGKLQGDEMRRPCNTFSRVLQIAPGSAKSSPRTPDIKKRKDQMKKVVCIPAPASATGKTNGAVVPSDLWAWRKYGQKPIKGSPHPRGYYRCSSSKGCSARKQVERSRTDPNMLVITYTSEHNHPWPTQRNALAGSTRSQPARNNPSTSKNPLENQRPLLNLKEEHKETASLNTPLVKEEAVEMDKAVELSQLEDFFTCWGELEADPMNLHFTEEVLGDKSDEERENKALDPFSFFDWAGNSFGEAKGGL